jgi:hypothetical protein
MMKQRKAKEAMRADENPARCLCFFLFKSTPLSLLFLIRATIMVGAEDLSGSAPRNQPQPQELVHLHIPEPMIFDLLRGLGARQREFEMNVL